MHLWLFIFHHSSSTLSSQPASQVLILLTNCLSPLLLSPVVISMDAMQTRPMNAAQSAPLIDNLSVPRCLSLSDCVITHHLLIADADRTDGRRMLRAGTHLVLAHRSFSLFLYSWLYNSVHLIVYDNTYSNHVRNLLLLCKFPLPLFISFIKYPTDDKG